MRLPWRRQIERHQRWPNGGSEGGLQDVVRQGAVFCRPCCYCCATHRCDAERNQCAVPFVLPQGGQDHSSTPGMLSDRGRGCSRCQAAVLVAWSMSKSNLQIHRLRHASLL